MWLQKKEAQKTCLVHADFSLAWGFGCGGSVAGFHEKSFFLCHNRGELTREGRHRG